MATAKTALPPSHGKLHKRNFSDTSNSIKDSPSMPAAAFSPGRPSLDFKRKITYDEPWEDSSNSSSNVKIKPIFRKLNAKDSGIVDLSRPAAENEGLAGLGLGINDGSGYGFTSKSVSDVSFVPMGGYSKSRHMRSVSNNSQFSTTTANSFQRPNAPYAHPMRQTPRPYTPPISKSYTTSLDPRSSDEFDTLAGTPLPDDDLTFRRLMTASTDPQGRRSGSISSSVPNVAAPQPLYIRTSDSLTRFTSPSQTSLSGVGGRSRGATLQSVDTMSPSSRPSMDKFGFLRQRSAGTESELVDPVESRAANIRAARQKYQEREDAKMRKLEKEEMKSMERDQRKQERKRRKSEPEERKARNDSVNNNNEKGAAAEEVAGREYAMLKPVNSRALPNRVDSISPGQRETPRFESGRKKKKPGAKTNWFGFLAWFRTRLLRLGRKMGMRS